MSNVDSTNEQSNKKSIESLKNEIDPETERKITEKNIALAKIYGNFRNTYYKIEHPSPSKFKNLFDYWNDGIEVIGRNFGKTEGFRALDNAGYIEPFKVTLSTIGNVNVAVTKGIANVGEGLVDAVLTVGGVLATPSCALVDLIAYGTGNDLGLTNNYGIKLSGRVLNSKLLIM